MASSKQGKDSFHAMTTTAAVRARLMEAGVPFAANDNISDHLHPGELEQLQKEVEERITGLLEALIIDTRNDHNTRETAQRVAKMYLREIFRGRYEPQPAVTDFPNAKGLDELYTVGPITVRSMCSHHLVPVQGQAWIGVIPSERVIGLSKFNRLADWVMSRPQIQEEATVQLADLIEKLIAPKGLAVVVRATHGCMTCRGVRESATTMATSVMRGAFLPNAAARAEFIALAKGQGL
jgi:GTP cyclohydrolase IA